MSEFKARLKGDHARGAVASQADTQQPGRRSRGVGERAKSGLSRRIARNACIHVAGKTKVWMIEDVEELSVDPQSETLGQFEPLCEVKIAPDKGGAAQRIPAEIAELAICRVVSTYASARTGINGRNKRVGVEPLNCSRLGDAGNRIMIVKRHAWNHAGKLWAASIDDAVAVCRIRCAQD